MRAIFMISPAGNDDKYENHTFRGSPFCARRNKYSDLRPGDYDPVGEKAYWLEYGSLVGFASDAMSTS